MNILSQKSVYEHEGFKMWVRTLEKYDPRGKDALFESVPALYTLKKTQDKNIINYMSRAL